VLDVARVELRWVRTVLPPLLRVIWVNPDFAHYRVSVYAALDKMLGGQLRVIFSASRMLPSVMASVAEVLGDRAVGLRGEQQLKLGGKNDSFANRGYNIPFQRGLITAITRQRPDVIISEGFFQWTPAVLWYTRRHRVPVVVSYERTVHTERAASHLRTAYRRWVARHVDAFCCNGSLSMQYCVEALGIGPESIVTGGMAADTEFLAAQCRAVTADGLAEDLAARGLERPVFACIGRLVRRKGGRELLAGWEVFTQSHAMNGGSLLFVGDGPERQHLEKIVRERSLPRVAFAGGVEYSKIPRFYALTDVLVMPTLEDNWSLVVPEAMACSKPVLCSRFNGCWPELVKDGVNGWTFDPRDSAELARLFETCVTQPELLPVMGRASREIVEDFSPDRAAKAFHQACLLALRRSIEADRARPGP
jgi:glycosyltransferase involved in cell wall biosynthesis